MPLCLYFAFFLQVNLGHGLRTHHIYLVLMEFFKYLIEYLA